MLFFLKLFSCSSFMWLKFMVKTTWLVVIPTPLNNMTSSDGMIIPFPTVSGKSIQIPWFQSPPNQMFIYHYMTIIITILPLYNHYYHITNDQCWVHHDHHEILQPSSRGAWTRQSHPQCLLPVLLPAVRDHQGACETHGISRMCKIDRKTGKP